jgi:hypothetical protein
MRGIAVLAAVAASFALAGGAGAVTSNGFKDGELHPNVGGILVPATGGGLALVCSGTLVSPTVFLTASHCTSFLESLGRPVFVSFDSTDIENTAAGTLVPGTPVTNPSYKQGVREDVSVIVLSTPVAGITPAALPPLGYLDGLHAAGALQGASFTSVGYGTEEKLVVKGVGPTFPFDGDREYGIGSFNTLTKQYLKLSQNQAHGDSGTCFGDSGGPTFLGAAPNDGDIVLAVSSTGDAVCKSTNVVSRTDSPSARAFLSTFGL